MKKTIILLSLLLITLLIPAKLNAEVKISETGFTVDNKNAKIGDQITVDIKIKTSGLSNNDNTYGIFLSASKISFDENILSPGIPSSSDFLPELIKTVDGEYYLIAIVNVKDTPKNCLTGNILYCGDYSLKLPFIIRNTNQTSTQIKLEETEIALLREDNLVELPNILEEDLDDIENIEKNFKTITYTTPQTVKINIEKEINTVTVEVEKKSSNTNLSSLEIYNYNIPFNKETKEYELSVSKNVNKLDVRAAVEDYKSSYKIIGNDDLKANDYKVQIEVTAEDGNKSIYTIKVNLKEDEITKDIVEKPKDEKKVNVKLDKKIVMLLAGIGGGFVLIILIIIITTIRKKKALNKMFKDL